MARTLKHRFSLLASTAVLVGSVTHAHAQSDARITTLQSQIQQLNNELKQIKRDAAARDAAVKTAQADAAKARAQAQETQNTVAHLPAPAGFGPLTNGRPGINLGFGAAHPDYPSPKTDFTSLSLNPMTTEGEQSGATGRKGEFHVGGITIQLGGFIEAAGIYRSRNETTDIGTTWNAIPFAQSQQYHENEVRESARQSRIALFVHGDIDANQHVSAYGEFDFLGAAGTANTNESNSYNPRIRQVYAAYDNDVAGLHFLGGQAWSLATMNRVGVVPRQEDVPLTIDAQYVPGFTWARQPQFRVAKDFDAGKYWLAASLESPQTTYSVASAGTGVTGQTVNFNNPGISQLTPGQAYSTDVAPDVIVKAAADPGYGHYEVMGIARFFQDRVSVVGNGHSNTRLAGGVGAGTILPILGNALSFEAHGLAGYGIGRYGTSGLPDSSIGRSGAPTPLPEVQALIGLVGHPKPSIDLYSYVGTEQIGRKYFSIGTNNYGYGNPLYSNAGCNIELSTAPCTGNTSGIVQGTLGGWWRFAQGDFGTLQSGVQYSYTRRSIFKGLSGPGGSGNQSTDDNIVMVSFRYLPFQ